MLQRHEELRLRTQNPNPNPNPSPSPSPNPNQVLNSLERIAAKLLKLVEGGPTATAPRKVYSPERSSLIRSVVKLGAAMDGERPRVRVRVGRA